MTQDDSVDEHGNYSPKCPFCGARECERHLLLDVEPGAEIAVRSLMDERSELVRRISREVARVVALGTEIKVECSDALIELLDAAAFASDGEALDPAELETIIACYLVDTGRDIVNCMVEEHAFEGDSPASATEFLRLYAEDRALAIDSIVVAVERDLALLSKCH